MGKRLGIGEVSENGERRSSFSKRANEGSISVINTKKNDKVKFDKYCPKCGHHKFFLKNDGHVYCAKCGYQVM